MAIRPAAMIMGKRAPKTSGVPSPDRGTRSWSSAGTLGVIARFPCHSCCSGWLLGPGSRSWPQDPLRELAHRFDPEAELPRALGAEHGHQPLERAELHLASSLDHDGTRRGRL